MLAEIFFHLRFTRIQTSIRLEPSLVRDNFSKIPKLVESNHNIWNLLEVTTSEDQKFDIVFSFLPPMSDNLTDSRAKIE